MPRLALLVLTLVITTVHSFAAPTPDAVIEYKKIDGDALTLHIFNPPNHKATDTRPAIVFFFGGGWKGGSPSHFYRKANT